VHSLAFSDNKRVTRSVAIADKQVMTTLQNWCF